MKTQLNINEEIINTDVLSCIEQQTDGRYPVMVATDVTYMRAIDYRSRKKGIHLVIARSFEHGRQAEQALGRVGRQGDPCKRVILRGVPLVNEATKIERAAVLMKFLKETRAIKVKTVERKRTYTKKNANAIPEGQGQLKFG